MDKSEENPNSRNRIDAEKRKIAETILHKHVDKDQLDDLSSNIWPDLIDALIEFEGIAEKFIKKEQMDT